jgi:hypothetical protein
MNIGNAEVGHSVLPKLIGARPKRPWSQHENMGKETFPYTASGWGQMNVRIADRKLSLRERHLADSLPYLASLPRFPTSLPYLAYTRKSMAMQKG